MMSRFLNLRRKQQVHKALFCENKVKVSNAQEIKQSEVPTPKTEMGKVNNLILMYRDHIVSRVGSLFPNVAIHFQVATQYDFYSDRNGTSNLTTYDALRKLTARKEGYFCN